MLGVGEPLHPDRITVYDGQTWVHEESLHSAGYEYPGVGTVVIVRGHELVYFEIGGRAVNTLTGETLPGYWLQRIEVPRASAWEDTFPEEWCAEAA